MKSITIILQEDDEFGRCHKKEIEVCADDIKTSSQLAAVLANMYMNAAQDLEAKMKDPSNPFGEKKPYPYKLGLFYDQIMKDEIGT